MYVVQAMHKGANILLPRAANIAEVRQLAEISAARGHDCLYRAFRLTGERWPNGEERYQFEVSFSSLGGKVTEYPDVTIPHAHW